MSKFKSILFPFIVTHKLSFVVEISYDKIRFYTSHARLVKNNATYTINSPYNSQDLYDSDGIARLQYCQNGDVMYLFHEDYPLKKLIRYANDDWRIEDLEFVAPWDKINTDENLSIKTDTTTGTCVLTANSSFFNEKMVGSYIRLTSNNTNLKPWVAETDYNTGDIKVSDGKQYRCVGNGKSGTIKPTHTQGVEYDGGLQWQYLTSNNGIVKITQFVDTLHVRGVVTETLPEGCKDGTTYWEMNIFNGLHKYPKAGAFFRNRFCILADIDNVPTVYCSCSDDYENFADKDQGEVLATNAITIPLTNGSYNIGKWIYGEDVLFVGTSSGEYVIDSATSGEAFAPDNSKCQCFSNIGSAPIRPIKIGSQLIFVSKNCRELIDVMYSFSTDAYEPNVLSLQGSHLLNSGIKDIVYQTSPVKTIFVVTEKQFVGITYSNEDKVVAFYRNDLSGIVERACVVPCIDTSLDELWVVVNREENRSIEWIDNNFITYPDELEAIEDPDIAEYKKSEYFKHYSVYLDGCVEGEFPLDENIYANIRIYHKDTTPITLTSESAEEVKTYNIADTNTYIDSTVRVKGNEKRIKFTWSLPLNDTFTFHFDENLVGLNYKATLYEDNPRIKPVQTSGKVRESISFGSDYVRFELEIFEEIPEERTVTGLSHLEGKEVAIFANGVELPHQVVNYGTVTIPHRYNKVLVGLPIKSTYIPQNIYIQLNNGSGIGDVQRIDHLTLMLWRSLGGKVGEEFSKMQDIYFREPMAKMNCSTDLYTGNKQIAVNFNTSTIKEKGAKIIIHNDSCFPMQILAIVPKFITSGNGL